MRLVNFVRTAQCTSYYAHTQAKSVTKLTLSLRAALHNMQKSPFCCQRRNARNLRMPCPCLHKRGRRGIKSRVGGGIPFYLTKISGQTKTEEDVDALTHKRKHQLCWLPDTFQPYTGQKFLRPDLYKRGVNNDMTQSLSPPLPSQQRAAPHKIQLARIQSPIHLPQEAGLGEAISCVSIEELPVYAYCVRLRFEIARLM